MPAASVVQQVWYGSRYEWNQDYWGAGAALIVLTFHPCSMLVTDTVCNSMRPVQLHAG